MVLEAHFIYCIHPSQYIKVIKYHLDPPLSSSWLTLVAFGRVKLDMSLRA